MEKLILYLITIFGMKVEERDGKKYGESYTYFLERKSKINTIKIFGKFMNVVIHT